MSPGRPRGRRSTAAADALTELLDGLRAGDGYDTPPLTRGTSGLGRIRELLTGLGARQGLGRP